MGGLCAQAPRQPQRIGAAAAIAAVAAVFGGWALDARATPPPSFDDLQAQIPSDDATPASLRATAEMVAIPSGRYPIGREDGRRDERPAHQVTLAAFRIDVTEVTNAAFAEFLNALEIDIVRDFGPGGFRPSGEGDRAAAWLAEDRRGSGVYPLVALDDAQSQIEHRAGRFAPAPGFEDHPVVETTWAGALAYCVWRGARLPTEVEWEASARGTEGRLYPWGDATPDPTRAFVSGRSGETGVVGARPAGASPFGALDMAGSLAEWTSTLKRPYPYDAADGREDPTIAGERVTRGGDYVFDAEADTLTATHRNGFSNAPERGHRHIGFRCAADGPAA